MASSDRELSKLLTLLNLDAVAQRNAMARDGAKGMHGMLGFAFWDGVTRAGQAFMDVHLGRAEAATAYARVRDYATSLVAERGEADG